MTLRELLQYYVRNNEGSFICLEIEGVNKIQTVSTNAYPLLDAVYNWYVDHFDVDNDNLEISICRDKKPF